MEKSWKMTGHGKVMEFSRSWKKSWKTQIWTNLFCRTFLWNTDLTTLLTKVFTMKDTESTLCKSRTYFEIVTMAKVCPGRVWWLLQHFSYILHFKTCEKVMEKGIESHGKVMEKSWKSHGISLRHSCGNPGVWISFISFYLFLLLFWLKIMWENYFLLILLKNFFRYIYIFFYNSTESMNGSKLIFRNICSHRQVMWMRLLLIQMPFAKSVM